MKKAVLRSISVLLMVMAVLAVFGAVTVRGGEFLDLSNFARLVLCGSAVLCSVLAAAAWVTENPREKRIKWVILCIAVAVILIITLLADSFRVPATEIIGMNG